MVTVAKLTAESENRTVMPALVTVTMGTWLFNAQIKEVRLEVVLTLGQIYRV